VPHRPAPICARSPPAAWPPAISSRPHDRPCRPLGRPAAAVEHPRQRRWGLGLLVHGRAVTETENVWCAPLDGSAPPRRLTDGQDHYLIRDVAPDGSRLLLAQSLNANEHDHLLLLDRETGALTQITPTQDTHYVYGGVFSARIKAPSSSWRISTMRPARGDAGRLALAAGPCHRRAHLPCAAPTARRISTSAPCSHPMARGCCGTAATARRAAISFGSSRSRGRAHKVLDLGERTTCWPPGWTMTASALPATMRGATSWGC
jgi:hypothetical protein